MRAACAERVSGSRSSAAEAAEVRYMAKVEGRKAQLLETRPHDTQRSTSTARARGRRGPGGASSCATALYSEASATADAATRLRRVR